ncbi:hypothetical protein M2408_001798 [Sphingobacterium sp. BIGb0165]|nr:hypothetical protein [Sphingobacterium sp. BIGb0165]
MSWTTVLNLTEINRRFFKKRLKTLKLGNQFPTNDL